MSNFVIMVDAGGDLPSTFIEKHDIHLVPMTITLDGETHIDDGGKTFSYKDFFSRLRDGAVPATSMVNVETFVEHYKEVLDTGTDLLVLTISSGISGTANSAMVAADEVRPLYPNQKILVGDTLGGSLGSGIVAYYATRLRDEGKTVEETYEWVERNRLNINHIVLIDDLSFLLRGGRISKTSAALGSLIGIKPFIDVDREGKLRAVGKKRGRRAALDDMIERMSALTSSNELDCLCISHADCDEDAEYLVSRIKERYKVGRVIKNFIGPLIGSHTGPGTVVLFFYGKERA